MLQEAHRRGRPLTNLAMQKLLYFAHALYLVERRVPLVSGYFEAWEYGPVHPAAYKAFRRWGSQPIREPAEREDLETGSRSPIALPTEPDVREHIERVMAQYGRLSAGQLVDISHAKGAPWDFALDKSRTSWSYGVRISEEVILSRFKHHKISVRDSAASGDPLEDTPPS